MSSLFNDFKWAPETTAKSVTFLWIVVVLLIIWVAAIAGYLKVSVDVKSGLSNPLNALMGPSPTLISESERSDASGVNASSFTGGFNAQAANFTESQVMNDDIYVGGLNAETAKRYFSGTPGWAELENAVVGSFRDIQLKTRYHNTTVAEKINILKLGAQRLGLTIPQTPSPTETTSGYSGSRGTRAAAKNRSTLEETLKPNY